MRTGDTPVPIPNTTVKTCAADGTMLGTTWESRWLPDPKKEKRQEHSVSCAAVRIHSDAYRDGCTGSLQSTLKTAHWKTSKSDIDNRCNKKQTNSISLTMNRKGNKKHRTSQQLQRYAANG